MRLADLLVGVPDVWVTGDPQMDVVEVRDDSRLVRPGDLFVAVAGTATDGRGFLADAVAAGARALLVERQVDGDGDGARPERAAAGRTGAPADFGGAVITVGAVRPALAVIAANRFGAARTLTLSAVTGTNGKTTTTYLIEAMLGAAGIRAGVVGTIAYRVGGAGATDGAAPPAFFQAAPLTTPGALALHRSFAEMRGAGATDVVLEASSHALDQGRLDGCRFRVAGLTNLTQDHLDYHGSMDAYFQAKAILFERLLDPADGVAVLPVDLPEGRAMRARVRKGAGRRAVLGVAVTPGSAGADVVVEAAAQSAAGTRARLASPVGPIDVVSPLVGDYNLANIVLAVGMAVARGLDAPAIAAGVARLRGVPGRLQRVDNEAGVLCLVDYAHTPDALERAIAAVRPLVQAGGRLVTVFGCGGDRDRSKRPLMGRAAVTGSDLTIVTSDNPRGEDPQSIIAMILEGVRGQGAWEVPADEGLATVAARPAVAVAVDRRAAIRVAIAAARPGDVLLIAGKGHEDYQIVGSTRIHFDDREEAAAAFAARSTAGGPR